eukprot:gb/GEZN01007794.1/.p1 GENE.gb/GEZN01007794.1/~~gb/GEZN01007794.1/.p1  ORF type:complete len:242 (+),score=34.38 gb/GEZN01007794.1/:28-753(+)
MTTDPVLISLLANLQWLMLGFWVSGGLLGMLAVCLMRQRFNQDLLEHQNHLKLLKQQQKQQGQEAAPATRDTAHEHERPHGHMHQKKAPRLWKYHVPSWTEVILSFLLIPVLYLVFKVLHGSMLTVLQDQPTPLETYFGRSLLSPEILAFSFGMACGAATGLLVQFFQYALGFLKRQLLVERPRKPTAKTLTNRTATTGPARQASEATFADLVDSGAAEVATEAGPRRRTTRTPASVPSSS